MVARTLAPNRLVICASPAYLAEHGRPMQPEDLVQHQCLVLEGANPWRFRGENGDLLTVPVRGCLQSDNGEVLRDAAINGLGIALQSTWAVTDQLKNGALVSLLTDFPIAIEAVVSAVYLNRSFLPLKTQAFIAFFGQRFGPTPYWDLGLT